MPIGVILVTAVAFFWPLLTPDASARQFIQHGDFTDEYFPYHSFAAQELWAGRLPLWNPYLFAGHPSLADIQTAFFYPVGIAFALLFGADGLSLPELQYRVVVAYPLAGFFCYLLAYELTSNRVGSLIAALTYAFGGFLTSYPMQQMSILETSIWLPLTLFLLQRSTSSARPLLWIVLAGCSLATTVVAGHPQMLLFLGYTATAYCLYACITFPSARSIKASAAKSVFGLLWRLTLMWALAAGLAAAQLLPAAELTMFSSRTGIPYEEAQRGYDPIALLAVLLPDLRGEHGPYVGLLPTMLGIVALAYRRRGRIWFWAGLALFGALLSLGGSGPLYPILHGVAPGFALFRQQERAIVLFALAMSVLAAIGYTWLTSSGTRQVAKRARWPRLYVPAIIGLCALALASRSMQWDDPLQGQVAYAASLLLAGVVLLASKNEASGKSSVWPVLAAALVIIDLFAVNYGSNLVSQSSELSPAARDAAEIIRADAASRSPGDPYRVRVQTDDQDVFPPNYGHIVDMQEIGGDSPLMMQRLIDLNQAGNEWRLWELLNVKYSVSRRELGTGLDQIGQSGDLRVYRMQWPIPRVWAVRDVRFASSPAEALELSFNPDLRPGFTAVLEEERDLGYPDAKRPEQTYQIVEYAAQRVRFDVSLSADALLVISEPYYPGWRASVDGRDSPIYRASYFLRAVPVPAGSHTVEMVYEPASFRVGLAISLVALFVVVALAVLALRSRSA